MLDYEKKLLADALSNANLAKLPTKMSPDNFTWIEAIAKIKKQDGSTCYGIAKRNPDLTYRITYINGKTAPIFEVEEVYTYVKINKDSIKKFADKEDRDGRISYLKSLELPYQIDFEKADIASLNEEIVKAALYQELNTPEE
jgi:hypothetical protein